jgi:SAM-dependent methyltransferase
MALAPRYFEWQASLVKPALGRRVVEVGCGTGNFTGHLLDRELVIALDIEAACVERVRERFPNRSNLHTVVTSPGNAEFGELARLSPDCCVCLNVLEHIEDDAGALRSMASIMQAGGRIVLILPAFPALYGPIDRNAGHFRRYTRRSVAAVAEEAGLTISVMRFMNFVGFFGWWANARVFRRTKQSASQIEFFDRWVLPATARIEGLLAPPFGQSLLVVLTRP